MRRAAIAATLVALLALPATALAEEPIDNQLRIQHLLPIAEERFGAEAHERCPAGIGINAADLGGATGAAATDIGEPGRCEIWIAERWREMFRGQLAAVLTHEMGHLTGLDESDDPDSIMFAGRWDLAVACPPCHQLVERRERIEFLRSRVLQIREVRRRLQRRLEWNRRPPRLRHRIRNRRQRIQRINERIEPLQNQLGP